MNGPRVTDPICASGSSLLRSDIAGEVLAKAKAVVDRLSVEFPAHASRDLMRLEQAAALMAGFGRATDPYYGEICRIAHDIRGQAEVFGFPLLTRLAGTLCWAMRALEPQDGAIMIIIDSHIAGMRALVDHRITGTKDRSALTIVTALELLVRSRTCR